MALNDNEIIPVFGNRSGESGLNQESFKELLDNSTPKIQGYRMALVGDSITKQCTSTVQPTETTIAFFGDGFIAWAMVKLNWAIFLMINAGNSGATTEQAVIDFETDVKDRTDIDMVHVLIGSNSLTTTRTQEEMWGDIKQIADGCINTGKLAILGTFWPNDNVAYTDEQLAKCFFVNNKIREYGKTTRGVCYVDYYNIVIEPTATAPLSLLRNGYTDGIHPFALFARLMGDALANVIQGITGNGIEIISSVIDSIPVNPNSQQLITNPIMTGSVVTASGSSSGFLPTNYTHLDLTAPTTTVYAKINSPLGFGEGIEITVTGNAGDSFWLLGQNIGALIGDGDTFWQEIYVEADKGNGPLTLPAKIGLRMFAGGWQTAISKNIYCFDLASDGDFPTESYKGILRTPPFGISNEHPATALLRLEIRLPETGTFVIRASNYAVYKNRVGMWSGEVGINHT